jgi:hypothetical protein
MFEEYDDISPWLYFDMMSKESFDLMQRSIEFFKSHFVGGEMVSEDENGEEVCDHPACELVVRSITDSVEFTRITIIGNHSFEIPKSTSFTVDVDCALCGMRIQLTGKPYVVKM